MANYYAPNEKINWLELPKAYAFNLKRQEKYQWYKPIVVALLGIVFYLILSCILFGLLIGYFMLTNSFPSDTERFITVASDPANPVPFTILLLSLAAIIPSYALAMKICGFKGLGCASSIDGKLRWDRIKTFLPLTFLAFVVVVVLETVINGCMNGWESLGTFRILPAGIVIALIIVPLQCAGEEYLCRSFLLQAFSSWIPIIVIPIILQAIVFGCMHASQYDAVGVVACAFTGLCAGYIVVKTGGLEGGIVLHACNNVVLFLQSCIFAAPAIQYSQSILESVTGFAVTIIGTVIILWLAKKHGMILKDE